MGTLVSLDCQRKGVFIFVCFLSPHNVIDFLASRFSLIALLIITRTMPPNCMQRYF